MRRSPEAEISFAAWVGLVANVVLMAVKFAAGIIGHSQAVVADAVHSLSDVATDAALIIGVRYWSAPADEGHPHGHRRIETLVTVFIGILLAGVALGIGNDAIGNMVVSTRPTPDAVALAGALVSIVIKEILYRWTMVRARRINSSALAANAWHHRSDALSSIPAALAVTGALVVPKWTFIDPAGAVVVCLFILFAAWRITRPALDQLIDAAAPGEIRRDIEALALAVPGVLSAHAIRTRYTGSKLAVDLHIEVDGELTVYQGHDIGEAVRRRLLEDGPNVGDCMVKVEPLRKRSGQRPVET